MQASTSSGLSDEGRQIEQKEENQHHEHEHEHDHDHDHDHEQEGPDRKKVLKKNRITVSCEPCRRKKIKCDRMLPCAACKARNIVCEWVKGQPARVSDDRDVNVEIFRLRRLVDLLAGRLELSPQELEAMVSSLPIPKTTETSSRRRRRTKSSSSRPGSSSAPQAGPSSEGAVEQSEEEMDAEGSVYESPENPSEAGTFSPYESSSHFRPAEVGEALYTGPSPSGGSSPSLLPTFASSTPPSNYPAALGREPSSNLLPGLVPSRSDSAPSILDTTSLPHIHSESALEDARRSSYSQLLTSDTLLSRGGSTWILPPSALRAEGAGQGLIEASTSTGGKAGAQRMGYGRDANGNIVLVPGPGAVMEGQQPQVSLPTTFGRRQDIAMLGTVTSTPHGSQPAGFTSDLPRFTSPQVPPPSIDVRAEGSRQRASTHQIRPTSGLGLPFRVDYGQNRFYVSHPEHQSRTFQSHPSSSTDPSSEDQVGVPIGTWVQRPNWNHSVNTPLVHAHTYGPGPSSSILPSTAFAYPPPPSTAAPMSTGLVAGTGGSQPIIIPVHGRHFGEDEIDPLTPGASMGDLHFPQTLRRQNDPSGEPYGDQFYSEFGA